MEASFSAKGYSPDPGKIQGISDMPAPQTKQELQSFSRCGQLPADIHATSESSHMEPLMSPTEKGEHLRMGPKCEWQFPENQRFARKFITWTVAWYFEQK